ncbi:MAG: hypothetical protein ABSH36_07680 [Solirubrobacteraceae bacterium]|jgi:hypothetical protein
MSSGESSGDEVPRTELGKRLAAAVDAVAAAVESVKSAISAIQGLVAYVVGLLCADWNTDKWLLRAGASGTGIAGATTSGFGYLHTGLALPAGAVFCVPLVKRGFSYLRAEADREEARRISEQSGIANLQDLLDVESGKRRLISRMAPQPIHPALEDQRVTGEVLDALIARGESIRPRLEVAFLLVKRAQGKYRVERTRGQVEPPLKRMTAWTLDEVLSGGQAFAELLSPHELWPSVVHFECGTCEYFVVGIAGSRVPDHMVLEISRAVTVLLDLAVNNADTEARRAALRLIAG